MLSLEKSHQIYCMIVDHLQLCRQKEVSLSIKLVVELLLL